MTDNDFEEFDPAELAAAQRLDREISDTFAGNATIGTDPTVLWLASSLRVTPPAKLERRIATAVRRSDRPRPMMQFAALSLAAIFFWHGVTNLLLTDWIARNIGEPGHHALIELGFAMMAAAVAVGAAGLRKKWTPVGVGAGVPLGVLLGAHGLTEVTVFAWGAVFHITEGVLAITMFVVWWRYSGGSGREGKV